ncbi:7, 8-Dihydro-6-hydroxymethylpterin-pyrophosphokinase, HPPK [Anopheles sinensis]|uniref:7, 8-Dihydro-6-hydroxymethylpterin-pyrophosphokinase, HPPK n=1 Tax=Anopheles sinensis TaxID=74873 RepID=A0A084VPY3_ANOSI|nr:7, 8-Dihydro-6-hydroxymethylpterin-pyrophosphokinase, HPPK [Anopheles sinensis]
MIIRFNSSPTEDYLAPAPARREPKYSVTMANIATSRPESRTILDTSRSGPDDRKRSKRKGNRSLSEPEMLSGLKIRAGPAKFHYIIYHPPRCGERVCLAAEVPWVHPGLFRTVRNNIIALGAAKRHPLRPSDLSLSCRLEMRKIWLQPTAVVGW